MKRFGVIGLVFLWVICLFPLVSMAVIPAPSGQQSFLYGPIADPVVNAVPSLARPIAFGPVAQGQDFLTVRIAADQFSTPVDIYAAFMVSTDPGAVFNVNTDTSFFEVSLQEVFVAIGTGQPPAGATPLMPNMTAAVNSTLFANIPIGGIPPGKYTVFLVATPVGTLSSFYLWQTEFTIGLPITVQLSGAQEVPPVSTPATGTATLAVNFDGGAIAGDTHFSGLTSAATAGHIHQGAAGANGGVVLAFDLEEPGTTGEFVTPAGSTLTAAQLTTLRNNGLYVNIHTGTNAAGEIRGQIVLPAVPITVDISGAQEVPPVNTPASGIANLTLNLATSTLNGTITFSGLSGPATAAHFHQAAAGATGLVVIPLTPPAATAGTINVSTTLTATLLTALTTNQLYINIHTAANPGGEIRGQVFYPAGAPLP